MANSHTNSSHSDLLGSSLELGRLSVREVEKIIRETPTAILSVGGPEPVGVNSPLGASSICAQALAARASRELRIPLAPSLPIGYSIMFKSFPGVMALRSSTMATVLSDLCSGFLFQGIRSLIFVDSSDLNEDASNECAKRARQRGLAVHYFSWQKHSSVRKRMSSMCPDMHDRCESAILSMASFIMPDLAFGDEPQKPSHSNMSVKTFQRWRKRGRDPEQFRKYFPTAWTSGIPVQPDLSYGAELFEIASGALIKEAKRILNL